MRGARVTAPSLDSWSYCQERKGSYAPVAQPCMGIGQFGPITMEERDPKT